MMDGYGEIIEKTEILSPAQKAEVRKLEAVCRKKDGIRLSYPEEPGEAECHYLLKNSRDGELISALAFIPYDDHTAECVAFTHPGSRRKGCFTRLLNLVTEEYEEVDLLFPVSGSCEDTLAALQALGAEEESREYQMQRMLTEKTGMQTGIIETGEAADVLVLAETADMWKSGLAETADMRESDVAKAADAWAGDFLSVTRELVFYPWGTDNEAAGALQTTPISECGVCLHHVEIDSRFRGRGLGSRMIRRLLEVLAGSGVKTVVLQVSADNIPALRLYEKTGFRITETLSYYWF